MQAINSAIERLVSVKARKGMFMGESVRDAEAFLCGFRQALMATGVPLTTHSEKILESRGWTFSSAGFGPSMREKGLTEQEVANQLIDALIEELRQLSAACIQR